MQHHEGNGDDREQGVEGEDLLHVEPQVLLRIGEGFVACHVLVGEL